MTLQHGKGTVAILDSKDLSQHCDNSGVTFGSMVHDVTTYGKDSQVNAGGLLTSSFTISGRYNTQAGTGPRAVIVPLIGQTVNFKHRPEGTGSGLPQDSVDVVVNNYVQTHPVGDYVTWSADLTGSDDVDHTAQ